MPWTGNDVNENTLAPAFQHLWPNLEKAIFYRKISLALNIGIRGAKIHQNSGRIRKDYNLDRSFARQLTLSFEPVATKHAASLRVPYAKPNCWLAQLQIFRGKIWDL